MNFKVPPSIVYTVGHSNGSFDTLATLLELHNVQVVADVRSFPFSKYNKQFDTDKVRLSLKNAGMLYVYLGNEIGGMPKGSQFRDEDGNIVYAKIAASPNFHRGLTRLESGMQTYSIALMCGEEDPSNCHRRLLIARELQNRDISVMHIRGDGALHSECDLEYLERNRSGANSNVEQLSLFNNT